MTKYLYVWCFFSINLNPYGLKILIKIKLPRTICYSNKQVYFEFIQFILFFIVFTSSDVPLRHRASHSVIIRYVPSYIYAPHTVTYLWCMFNIPTFISIHSFLQLQLLRLRVGMVIKIDAWVFVFLYYCFFLLLLLVVVVII